MNNLEMIAKNVALLLAVFNRDKEKDNRTLSVVLSIDLLLSVIQLVRMTVALRKDFDGSET